MRKVAQKKKKKRNGGTIALGNQRVRVKG